MELTWTDKIELTPMTESILLWNKPELFKYRYAGLSAAVAAVGKNRTDATLSRHWAKPVDVVLPLLCVLCLLSDRVAELHNW